MKKNIWNEIDEHTCKEVASGYIAGCNSSVLASRFDISVSGVFKCLKRQGVKSRSISEAKRKYYCDETYFSKIDSHEKAQILGMIAADGNVSSDSRVFEIILQAEDKAYVQHIKKCLKYDGPIAFCKKRASRSSPWYPYVRLSITSSRLCEDLVGLGIVPAKSLKLKFPTREQVPEEFLSSFILGYFEGDGSINVSDKKGMTANIKICVTREFGDRLAEILKSTVSCGSSISTPKTSIESQANMHSIGIGGSLQAIKLCEWMYSKAPFRMKRKHDRYLHLLSYYDAEGNRIKESGWGRKFADRCKVTHKENGTWAGRAPKREHYLLSPDQKVTRVTRLCQLARETGMQKHRLYGVANGKKGYDSHHGWRLATADQVAAARASNTLVDKIYEQPVYRPYAGVT